MGQAFHRVLKFLRHRGHYHGYCWIVLLTLFFVLLARTGGGEETQEQQRAFTSRGFADREQAPVEMSGAATNPRNGRGGDRAPERKTRPDGGEVR